ncbi:MAG: type VI secretion protein [Sphingomonadales bacterium]|nr:type VI secretion protein [Sphingomonadales bacterium]
MKKAIIAAALFGTALPGAAGAQGIPVYDNANTLQMISQVKNSLEQIRQGEQAIAQAKQTFQSLSKLTDAANWAQVLNTAAVSRVLPSGVTDIAALARSDYNGLGSLGSSAQQLSSGYTVSFDGPGAAAYNSYLKAVNQGPSVAAALGNSVSYQSQQVDQGLDQLRTQLASAQDPKDTLDLTARATIEAAKVNNRIVQMMAISQYYSAAERMRLNQYRVNRAAADGAAARAIVEENARKWDGY